MHRHSPEEERAIRDAALDETLEESFPASDPLSTTPDPDSHEAFARTRARGRAPATRSDEVPEA